MEKKFQCPGCGTEGSRSSDNRICISKNAQLKEEILCGSYFEWRCSSCGKRFFVDDVLLYNDDEKKFMVYYVPGFKKDAFDVPTVLTVDPGYDTENSVLRVAADFVSFAEKIRILEEGLDDRAIEAIKAVYSSAFMESGGKKIYNMIFEEADDEAISFSVFLDDEDFIVDIPREAYDRTKADFSSLFREPVIKQLLRIDQDWLAQVLGRS